MGFQQALRQAFYSLKNLWVGGNWSWGRGFIDFEDKAFDLRVLFFFPDFSTAPEVSPEVVAFRWGTGLNQLPLLEVELISGVNMLDLFPGIQKDLETSFFSVWV